MGHGWLRLTVAALALSAATPARADFAFPDGDAVIFLGDSNTAAGWSTTPKAAHALEVASQYIGNEYVPVVSTNSSA